MNPERNKRGSEFEKRYQLLWIFQLTIGFMYVAFVFNYTHSKTHVLLLQFNCVSDLISLHLFYFILFLIN